MPQSIAHQVTTHQIRRGDVLTNVDLTDVVTGKRLAEDINAGSCPDIATFKNGEKNIKITVNVDTHGTTADMLVRKGATVTVERTEQTPEEKLEFLTESILTKLADLATSADEAYERYTAKMTPNDNDDAVSKFVYELKWGAPGDVIHASVIADHAKLALTLLESGEHGSIFDIIRIIGKEARKQVSQFRAGSRSTSVWGNLVDDIKLEAYIELMTGNWLGWNGSAIIDGDEATMWGLV